MRITALEVQAHNPERVNLFVDGKFLQGMSAEIMLKLGLHIDQELSASDLAQIQQEEARQQAMDLAINYLSFRPRSQAEVRRHLLHKSIAPEIVETVLERLRQLEYIDDRAFASFWVENREQFKPRGSQGLRSELRMKGIEREIVEEVVSDENDATLALRAAERKAASLLQMPSMDYKTFRNRLGGFLQRRGFSYEVVSRTVRALWPEHATDESDE